MKHRVPLLLTTLTLCTTLPQSAQASFGPRYVPFAQRKANSDAYLVVRLVQEAKPDPLSKVRSFEVVKVLKNCPTQIVKPGEVISVVWNSRKEPGPLGMMEGHLSKKGMSERKLRWYAPDIVTEATVKYISDAPAFDLPDAARVGYFLKHLEHSDDQVDTDAWVEVSVVSDDKLFPFAKRIGREKLRGWIVKHNFDSDRVNLYSILLGFCGNADDAKFLEEYLVAPLEPDGFRVGLEGVMIGYLWLTGEKGLQVLERTSLEPRFLRGANGSFVRDQNGNPRPFPFQETYSAMLALEYLYEQGNDRISKNRLRQSMRILLDRPELADLVIHNLADWEDWSVQDRLMKLYEDEAYNKPDFQRMFRLSVIRYMLQSADWPAEKNSPPPHVIRGRMHLETLEKLDAEYINLARMHLAEETSD